MGFQSFFFVLKYVLLQAQKKSKVEYEMFLLILQDLRVWNWHVLPKA